MGFIPYSYDAGQPLPSEYLKVSGGTIVPGLCMKLSNGALTVSAEPDYIALCDMESAPANTVIPAMRVTTEAVFEAPLASGSESLTAGGTAGISADGLSVSASASVKNIQIISVSGGKCRCRFVS